MNFLYQSSSAPPSLLRRTLAAVILMPTTLLAASFLLSSCALGQPRSITIIADSPKLKQKNIPLPTIVTMTEVGHFHAVVDVSWLASHFEQLARSSLPREGGSGGDRYHFSKFSLTANPDGTLKGFVHIKQYNYKYTKLPPIYIRTGSVESDVTATITPIIEGGHATTITSTHVVKTSQSGFVKLWNNALPKIWFSLDRKFQTANNAVKKTARRELPALMIQKNPALDPFVDDILKRGLVEGKEIKFNQGDYALTLVLDYKVVGGLPAYYDIYKSYRDNAYKLPVTQSITAASPAKRTASGRP